MKRNISKQKGSILFTSVTLVLLVAIGAALTVQMLVSVQRINQRRRELSRAYYTAEAGVAQVQHWGNYPSDYTLNPTLFQRVNDGVLNIAEALVTNSSLVSVNTDPAVMFPTLFTAVNTGTGIT